MIEGVNEEEARRRMRICKGDRRREAGGRKGWGKSRKQRMRRRKKSTKRRKRTQDVVFLQQDWGLGGRIFRGQRPKDFSDAERHFRLKR